ncbi:MAG: HAD family hydrolase [Cyanobacteria bacterium P01_F01_bin.150]
MGFNHNLDILALDFDGVICDGLIEYFQTAWSAYCQIWQPSDTTPPDGIAEQFYPLRPVIETGWEMPVLLRSLLLKIPADDILNDWPGVSKRLVANESLAPKAIAKAVDGSRDLWIQSNLDHWLSQHRFYPGVLDWVKGYLASPTHTVIISTKEGRFIQQLLAQQQVDIPPHHIYGKEVKRPKYETLRLVMADVKPHLNKDSDSLQVAFLEDRLNALQLVADQPDLKHVQLYLADWGYNTAADRSRVESLNGIELLSLSDVSP